MKFSTGPIGRGYPQGFVICFKETPKLRQQCNFNAYYLKILVQYGPHPTLYTLKDQQNRVGLNTKHVGLSDG